MSRDPFALVWPRPQRVELLGGVSIFPRQLSYTLVLPRDHPIEAGFLRELSAFMSSVAKSTSDSPAHRERRVELSIDAAGALPPQGYRLGLQRGQIRLCARDAAGAWNGLCTLYQVIASFFEKHGRVDIRVPDVAIEDWPDFPARGVMLDVSRTKVPSMGTLFALVDELAALKINQLQLYMEHTFAYRGHEVVWKDASPFTPDEIRALDAFCRARSIELVPNQQSFGHMHRWLKHDAYRHLAEVPEGIEHAFATEKEPFALCPIDPGSLALIDDLYDQLLPHFSSAQFNVGLDETFDLGLGRSRAVCEERGTARVYLDYLLAIHRRVAQHGRRMQFWGDIIVHEPERIAELPRDAIALEWGYEEGHPFDEHLSLFAKSGLQFYVCPGTSSWQSVAGRTKNALANLRSAALSGRRFGAAGYLVTDWGDRGHLQPQPVSYAGFTAGAGFAWNASSANDAIDLPALLDAHWFRDRAGVVGRVACELGDAYLATGSPSTNGSALFFLLSFANGPLPHARTPDLSLAGLARAQEYIGERRAMLANARPASPSSELARSELEWAADLLDFACRFGTARLQCRANEDARAIPSGERGDLARRLEPLIETHRRLWRTRNRPGGLSESAGWLERVLALLR